jgi:DNA-binding NarL/FixJ family response regulator
MTAEEALHTRASVAVVGDGPRRIVADQLRADGFAVVGPAAHDPDPAVLVFCWLRVTQAAVAEARRQRDGDFRALVAVVGSVPTPHLVRALAAHLDGVVLLDTMRESLRPTLLAVLAGQSSHPLAFREQLDRPGLSNREKQVLAMVVLGLPNVAIAQKLFVTEASVKAHLTSAFAKLGVRSREAATALILDPEAGYGPGILRITPDRQPPEVSGTSGPAVRRARRTGRREQ